MEHRRTGWCWKNDPVADRIIGITTMKDLMLLVKACLGLLIYLKVQQTFKKSVKPGGTLRNDRVLVEHLSDVTEQVYHGAHVDSNINPRGLTDELIVATTD